MANDPSAEAEWQVRTRRAGVTADAILTELRFTYPWDGLEEVLRSEGNAQLQLVGYGSLLNPVSAARTIRDTPAEGHPAVLAFGAQRVFDYVMPQGVIDRYVSEGASTYPSDQRAALNTRWTGKPQDVLNGRLIPLAVSDLDGLREREQGYDLEPVAVVPWEEPETSPSLGFVLCATERPWNGKTVVDRTIKPYPPYLDLCRVGAAITDQAFEQCLIDTCWLADGTTPLNEWLK